MDLQSQVDEINTMSIAQVQEHLDEFIKQTENDVVTYKHLLYSECEKVFEERCAVVKDGFEMRMKHAQQQYDQKSELIQAHLLKVENRYLFSLQETQMAIANQAQKMQKLIHQNKLLLQEKEAGICQKLDKLSV